MCRTDAEDAAEIDAFINDIMTSEEMVGLTVAVVKEGRPLLASGYGIMDINTLGDVTNETLFYLASCSKAFNAALVSHMLSLDGRYDIIKAKKIYMRVSDHMGLQNRLGFLLSSEILDKF